MSLRIHSLSRPLVAGLAVASAALAGIVVAVTASALPAAAATSTLFASPSGGGSTCSSSQPCSLSGAQAAVRSMVAGASGDIVVQLADGVYRPSAPLRFTAADSGINGAGRTFGAAGHQRSPADHRLEPG